MPRILTPYVYRKKHRVGARIDLDELEELAGERAHELAQVLEEEVEEAFRAMGCYRVLSARREEEILVYALDSTLEHLGHLAAALEEIEHSLQARLALGTSAHIATVYLAREPLPEMEAAFYTVELPEAPEAEQYRATEAAARELRKLGLDAELYGLGIVCAIKLAGASLPDHTTQPKAALSHTRTLSYRRIWDRRAVEKMVNRKVRQALRAKYRIAGYEVYEPPKRIKGLKVTVAHKLSSTLDPEGLLYLEVSSRSIIETEETLGELLSKVKPEMLAGIEARRGSRVARVLEVKEGKVKVEAKGGVEEWSASEAKAVMSPHTLRKLGLYREARALILRTPSQQAQAASKLVAEIGVIYIGGHPVEFDPTPPEVELL